MAIGPGPEIQWRAKNVVDQWWTGLMQIQNRLDLPDIDLPTGDGDVAPQLAASGGVERLGRQATMQRVEVELYVEALWRFRQAVLFTIHHVDSGHQLVPSLDAFDSAVPSLEVLRDLTAEFSSYLVHGGKHRRGEQGTVTGVGLGQITNGLPNGGTSLSWESHSLRTNDATAAARDLYEAISAFLATRT
jgi:hypothetical protein